MSIEACAGCGTIWPPDDKSCPKCGKAESFEVGAERTRAERGLVVDEAGDCLGCQ